MKKEATANVTPVRQRSQYTCMATSMMMCLKALGVDTDEDTVNRVMGAQPMQGASWENAIACAQHYGMRVHLICPATLRQVKEFTDRGSPVMIAWNPEGRDWSHASVIFDVDDDLTVSVADPNIPDPDETVRVVPKEDFYHKWFEKWPNYLVRRTAMAVEREITPEGRQMVASEDINKAKLLNTGVPPLDAQDFHEDPLVYAVLGGGGNAYFVTGFDGKDILQGVTPFSNRSMGWSHFSLNSIKRDPQIKWNNSFRGPVPISRARTQVQHYMSASLSQPLMTRRDYGLQEEGEAKEAFFWNKKPVEKEEEPPLVKFTGSTALINDAFLKLLADKVGMQHLKQMGKNFTLYLKKGPLEIEPFKPGWFRVLWEKGTDVALNFHELINLLKVQQVKPIFTAGYKGNPDGKDIYPVQIDHGYENPVSGGTDVMQQLQHKLRIEQGLVAKVAARYLMSEVERPVIWLDNWRIFVNRPFVNKIRQNPDYLFMKLPRDGFIWTHPMTDIDPEYNGGSEYDFHFHPENSGWRSVTFNMHHRDLFLKEADRLGATVVKKAFPQNMTHYVFGAENESK